MKKWIPIIIAMSLSICVVAQEPGNNSTPPGFPAAPGEPQLDMPADPGIPSPEKIEASLPPALDEEKSKQISKYFEEALRNYEDILGDQKNAEVKTTRKRIETNLRLLKEQQNKLKSSETTLRKIKLEYIRRFLILKNARDKGKIDKVTYQKHLDKIAQDYRYKVETFSQDREFYKGQTQKAAERLKALQELNRINRIVLAQEAELQGKKLKPAKPLTKLEKLMKGIQNLKAFEIKNFCTSPEFK